MIHNKWIPVMLCTLFIGFGVVSASLAQQQGPCAQIIAACQNAGFVQGGAKSRIGLQVNCVQPIMQGKAAEYKAGKPLPQVDPQLVAACKAKNPRFGQPQAPPPQSGKEQPQASPGTGWPKELDAGGTHFVIYQPQAESWQDGQLQARSVVMISEAGGNRGMAPSPSRRTPKKTRTTAPSRSKILRWCRAIFPPAPPTRNGH